MAVRLTSEGDAELAKVESYEGLRQVGNELFAANDFASAAAHYSDALRYCGGDPTRGLAAGEEYAGGDRDVEAAHKAALVLTNRALARLKIGGAELVAAALADARAAVLLHPTHAKAYRWLSKALELTGDAEGALRALARARNLKAKAKRDEEAGAKAVAAAAEAEAAEAKTAEVKAAEAKAKAARAKAAEAAPAEADEAARPMAEEVNDDAMVPCPTDEPSVRKQVTAAEAAEETTRTLVHAAARNEAQTAARAPAPGYSEEAMNRMMR